MKELNEIINLMLNDMASAPIPFPELELTPEDIADIKICYEIYRVERLTFEQFLTVVKRVMIDSEMNSIQTAQFCAKNMLKLWQTKK